MRKTVFGSIKEGLVAYYPFDGTGNDLVRANNATFFECLFDAGKIGQSVKTTATNTAFVSIPDNPVLNFSNTTNDLPFTISLWVKLTSGQSSNPEMILSKGSIDANGNANPLQYNILIFNNTINFTINSIGGFLRKSTSVLAQNVWQNIVFSYNANGLTNGIKVYLNGIEQFGMNEINSNYTKMEVSNHPLTLGIATGSFPFQCKSFFDDLCIWNKVLTPAEVLQNYNRTTNLI